MELTKIFRGLLLLNVLAIVAYAVAPKSSVVDEAVFSDNLLIAYLVLVVVYLVSLVLLFLLKPLGRNLFSILFVTGILLSFVMPESTTPTTNIQGLLGKFEHNSAGAILAMLYLTPLKDKFTKSET